MKTISFFLVIVFFLKDYRLYSQVQITVNRTAQQLAQKIAGQGVLISNATLTCHDSANAIFTAPTSTPLGLTSGIMLSTGRLKSTPTVIGFDTIHSLTADNRFSFTPTSPQDAQLGQLSTNIQYDLCKLEFQLVPQGDTLRINYVFGSEEYPGANCTNFNDAFGIFVSGPGLTGFQNYAKIPGTNIDVGINSVNDGSVPSGSNNSLCTVLGPGSPFTSLYQNNTTSNISYHGFSLVLQAKVPVIVGSTYNIKVAIADMTDPTTDSKISIQEGGISSLPLFTLEGNSGNGSTIKPFTTTEGCSPAQIRIIRPPSSAAMNFTITFKGNALNATDYNLNTTSSFSVPANNTSFPIDLTALVDNFLEPNDSVVLVFSSGGLSDSVVIYIRDYLPNFNFFNASNDTTVCSGRSVELRSQNFPTNAAFSWSPTTNLINSSSLIPIFNAPVVSSNSTFSITFTAIVAGCPNRDSTLSITVQPAPNITFSQPFYTFCLGDSAQIVTNIAPLGNYTYAWTPAVGLSNSTIPNPKAAPSQNLFYKLQASSTLGCSDVDSVQVIVSNIRNEISSIFKQNATCGQSNGLISVTTSAINSPYLFRLNNGSFTSNSNFTNLVSGNYTLRIQNSLGCFMDTLVTITTGANSPHITLASSPTSCGLSNGRIIATVTGGVGPVVRIWNPPLSNGDTLNNVAAGVYTLVVLDSLNCSFSQSISVGTSSLFTLQKNIVQPACGNSNGQITILPNGGKAPYTFIWSNGSTATNLTNLAEGKYYVTATDSVGCVRVDSVILVNSPPISATKTVFQTTCNQNNGIILMSPTLGTPPYSYNWSNGSSGQAISGLSAGMYRVTITDSRSCIYIDSVLILPSTKPQATLEKTNPTCGLVNGKIKINTISLGKPPYTKLWSNGSTSDSIQNLTSGTYSVTITDSLGCSSVFTETINMVSNPIVILSIQNGTCGNSNGSVFTTVINGLPPYSYSWSNGATSQNLSNLAPGKYYLTLTDASGCIRSDSATITTSPPLDATIHPTHTTCNKNNGAISISNLIGVAPFRFTWNNGSPAQNRNNLAPGLYSVLVTDSLQCNKVFNISISASTNPKIELLRTHASCGRTVGNIKAGVQNGTKPYNFYWSNGTNGVDSIGNLSVGSYSVTVTDSIGCIDSARTIIHFLPLPSFKDSSVDVNCGLVDNGKILISNILPSNGVYTYFFKGTNTPDTTFSNLTTGIYEFKLRDSLGCEVAKSIQINNDQSPEIELTTIKPSCNQKNGSITANITNGNAPYKFKWLGLIADTANYKKDTLVMYNLDSNTLYNIGYGIYSVEVTDANNCKVEARILLRNNSPLSVILDFTNTRCDTFTGSISPTGINGTAPYSYFWKNDTFTTQNIDSLSQKTYILRVLDSNKCILDTSQLIDFEYRINLSVDSMSPKFCNNPVGFIRLKLDTIVPPLNITWNGLFDSTLTKSGLNEGVYDIRVVDSNKCKTVTQVLVENRPVVSIQSLSVGPTHCGKNDGQVFISELTGDSIEFYPPLYSWNTGESTSGILNKPNGTYTVIATDRNNCKDTASATITPEIPPTISFSVKPTTCGLNNGEIDLIFDNNRIDSIAWDFLPNTNQINRTNQNPGMHYVEIFDVFGCKFTDSVIVPITPKFQISPIVKNSFCTNGNGTISLNPSNGLLPIQYIWSNLSTAADQANLAAGFYEVTITDSRGCVIDTSFTVQFLPSPQVTFSPSIDQCKTNTGAISTNILSGTPPFLFNWSNGATTANLSNIEGGDYILVLRDANNCIVRDTVTVPFTPKVTLSKTIVPASCNQNNGAITITPQSGKAPYNYSWSNNSNANTIQALNNGIYIVTVTDSNLCTKIDTILVDRLPIMVINHHQQNEKCSNSNGSIAASIQNNVGPFSVQWSNSSTTLLSQTGLKAGNYTITIVDSINCSVSKTITIVDSSGPQFFVTNTPASCGLNNGIITVNVSGMNPPFQYFWNNLPSSTSTISGINGGRFIFKTIDNKNCVRIDTFDRDSVGNFELSFKTYFASCNLSNGSIKVNPKFGQAPISFSWNSGNTGDSIINLASGKYIVTATDFFNCTKIDSVVVIQYGAPSPTFTITPSNCKTATGTISTTVLGGKAPLSFLWSGGQTTKDIVNLTPGTYSLTITDSTGCQTNSSSIVPTNGITSISPSIIQPKCEQNNGKIKLTPIGGFAPYSYFWTNSTPNNRDSIVNVGPGKYLVTVTDNNNCSYIDSFNLTNQASPVLTSSVVPASCGLLNGAISTNRNLGTPPFIYLWSHNPAISAENISGIDSGNYTLIVRDANLCADTLLNLRVNRIPDITVKDSIVKSICGLNNGGVYLDISGGEGNKSIRWSNGSVSSFISGVLSGTYIVNIQDQNQCSKSFSYTIENIPKPQLIPSKRDAACGLNNGWASISIAPNTGNKPFSYIWSNGSTDSFIENLAIGNYKVTVTDSLNCISDTLVIIGNAVEPFIQLSSQKNVVCTDSNGSISINPIRFLAPRFNWSNGDTTKDISNLKKGFYTVTISDIRGCVLTSTFEITDQPGPILSFNTSSSYCNLPTGNINTIISLGTPPFSYQWSNGRTTKDNLLVAKGTYKLTITDSNGCTDTFSTVIQDLPDNLRIDSIKTRNLSCFNVPDGELTVFASNGNLPYRYKTQLTAFQPNNQFTGLSAQKYIIEVSDNLGCFRIDSTIVTQPTQLEVSTVFKKNLSCFESQDGILKVAASGGTPPYTYLWPEYNVSRDSIDRLDSESHLVIATDSKGCSRNYIDSLTQPTKISLIDSEVNNPKCSDQPSGNIKVTIAGASPPYTYLWSNGKDSSIVDSLLEGTYSVTVTDFENCKNIFTFNLVDPNPIGFDSIRVVDLPCPSERDGQIYLKGKGGQGEPYSYSISNDSAYTSSRNHYYLDSGIYRISVMDRNNCKFFDTISILNAESIEVKAFPKNSEIIMGNSVDISFEVTKGKKKRINSYEWSPKQIIECTYCENTTATPFISTNVLLSVRYNNLRCLAQDTIFIKVTNPYEIHMPDIFSPNADGQNDQYKVYGNGIKQARLRIFNRWGELMYETENGLFEGWDGTFRGEIQQAGVYVYTVEAIFLNKEIKTKMGNFNLLR